MPPNNVAMLPVADLRKSLPNGKNAAQYLPEPGSFTQRRLKFYNASDKSITFRVRPTDTRPIAIDRIQGRDAQSARVQAADVIVTVPPHRTFRLTVHLKRQAFPVE